MLFQTRLSPHYTVLVRHVELILYAFPGITPCVMDLKSALFQTCLWPLLAPFRPEVDLILRSLTVINRLDHKNPENSTPFSNFAIWAI